MKNVRRTAPLSFTAALILLGGLAFYLGSQATPRALAATITWTGATSTDWHVSSNWSGNAVPAAGDDVVIPSGGGNNPVATDPVIVINSLSVGTGRTLSIGDGNTVTVNGNVTIDGTLTETCCNNRTFNFNGATFTNNGTVTIIDNFNLSGTGAQTIGGTGSWTTSNITIAGSSSTSVVNSVTLGNTNNLVVNGTLTVNNPLTINGPNLTNNGTISVSNTLTFVGATTKSFQNGATATVSGGGLFMTKGTVTLDNRGSFNTPLEVNSGTTTATDFNDLKTQFDGTIVVDNGATLQASDGTTITATKDVTIAGTLTEQCCNNRIFNFTGPTFTNNGTVTLLDSFNFNGAGAQSIAGSGTWTTVNISIGSSSSTSLASAQNFGNTGTVTVNGGGALTVNNPLTLASPHFTNNGAVVISNTLTYNGGGGNGHTFVNAAAATVSGSGKLLTQGITTLDNRGSFSVPLEVNSGTTTATDFNDLKTQFDGTVVVDNGATLQAGDGTTITATKDVTIAGTLTEQCCNNRIFNFTGPTFTNNGTVTLLDSFNFNGAGAQSIAGSGTWTTVNISIGGSSSTSLAGAQSFANTGTVTINGGGTFAVNNPLTVASPHFSNNGAVVVSNTLTYNGGGGNGHTFLNAATASVSGNGKLLTQGITTLDNRGIFSVPLEVNSGTTTAVDLNDFSTQFDGAIIVDNAATFQNGDGQTVIAGNDVTVNGNLTYTCCNNRTFRFNGSTFTNAGSVSSENLVFGGATQTVTGPGTFSAIRTNVLLGSTVTLAGNYTFGNTTISGALNQGVSAHLMAGPITVSSGGTLTNLGNGGLTLSGDVTNSGLITLDSNGAACGGANSILIRSTAGQRSWSGPGTFTVVDVDAKDQGGSASIVDIAGTNSGNNNSNWSFLDCVHFNSDNYVSPEGCTAINITVTRAGSLAGAASVDYLTSDGTALQRTDYSIGSGSLSFAPGDSSKSFPVLLCKDAYNEGPETLNITLSSTTGPVALVTPNTATVTVIDDLSVPTNSQPSDDAQTFVCHHYHDFLTREPDAPGLAYWTSQITQCGNDSTCIRNKRNDVSNSFYYELEFQQTASYVYRLYRAAFGNNQPFPNPNPDPTHPGEERKVPLYLPFMRDRARVRGGSDTAQLQIDLANLFVARNEFKTKYPASLDGPSFVDALLANIRSELGVDLATQRNSLITLFNSGGRGAVLYRLADDDVATNPINNRPLIDAEYNRAFVFTQYAGYLRRDADMPGFLFWLGQVNRGPLRDGNTQHAMVCSFITSAEYQQRFSAVVTHSNAECPQ